MPSGNDEATYGIGEVSRQTDLSIDTLRYYEHERLIGPVPRTLNGRRRYSHEDVAWLRVVTCLRQAGLSIADIRRFAQLLREHSDAGARTGFLLARRAELHKRLQQLQAAISVLDHKIAHYSQEENHAVPRAR